MNARKMIIKAFYALLEKQAISSISVGRIIETAEISKPTFYRYFYNKYEILTPIFAGMLDPLEGANSLFGWEQALTRTMEKVYENKNILKNGFKTEEQRNIRDSYMMKIVEESLCSALTRKGADIADSYVFFSVRSYSRTLVAAICGWANDGDRAPVDETVHNLQGTIPHSIYKYLQ